LGRGANWVEGDIRTARSLLPHYHDRPFRALIAGVVLFTLDRQYVGEISWQTRTRLARMSSDTASYLTGVFRQRTSVVRALALSVRDATPDEMPGHFEETARLLLSGQPDASPVALIDEDLNVLSSWPGGAASSTQPSAPFHDEDAARDAARRAFTTGNLAISRAYELPAGDLAVLAIAPARGLDRGVRRAVASEFGVWRQASGRLSRATGGNCAVSLKDESGRWFPRRSHRPDFSTTQAQAFEAGPATWWIYVHPSERAGASLGFARIVLWGLGLVLILSFFLFYYELARKNAELKDSARHLRRHAEELQKAHDRLLRVNRELDDFTYIVSHDLKEPLRGIQGLTRLLLEEHHSGSSRTS